METEILQRPGEALPKKNILEYLEATARRLPEKTAFADENGSLTFGELIKKARAVGSFLLEKGITGEPVLVYMNKSPEAIAAFLGCVYAGCFYVPLDAEMPLHRMQLIFETLHPRAVLCDGENEAAAERLCGKERVISFAVAETAEILPEKLRAVREVQIDTDPLYIVFTSGSTGVPKGVCACHRSVIDYTEALSAALDFDEHCVFGNQTPLYFDAPLKEIMPALKFGATVWFIPRQCFLFPMLLCDFLNRHEINTVCFVASALTMVSSLGVLKKNPPRYLRTVAFGSEVFPAAQYNLWKAALPSARFFNLYGPTECTGMSCFYEVKGFLPEEKPIPIGRPFRNTAAFLLDGEGKRILPIPGETGEAGELYLRGTCVTLGYYQNPEKTAEAFLQNPLQSAYPEPVYKTGDLCRYDGDGNLLFVARADQQIKHMGHRIELGEIEAAAHRTGGVTAVCCFYDAEKKRIHLCFAGSITGSELKAALKELLPRYMLPGECHRLERLPMTPNGKIDRRALREAYLPKDGAGADGAETPGANAPV